MHKKNLKIFWLSILITILAGIFALIRLGIEGLWIFVILVIIEITFSFDNAIVNSKVLEKMSNFWRIIFLTVGIFIAVFVVRFLLPIFIVMISGGIDFTNVINLALNKPDEYSRLLHEASPYINAFGGTFLLMIAISYFIDTNKKTNWIKVPEIIMKKAGRFENLCVFLMLSVALIVYILINPKFKEPVLVASIFGILLHIGLDLFSSFFDQNKKVKSNVKKNGMAALVSFVYLELLDMSFSLDGVIGAFAITGNVILIILGLGVGAIWVRSMTIYLLESGMLNKYKYLEHGAHWAILVLGVLMILKIFNIHFPEWFVGGAGILFIILSIISSKKSTKSKK